MVSLVKGKRIGESIDHIYGSWHFEDLWLPFHCVSTNLTSAREVVHTSGPLAPAIKASVAIPGVIPPVPWEGDLLVDGGVLNNLPGDTMRRLNPTGTIIAVDVAPASGPRANGYQETSVSGWKALWAKLRRQGRRYPDITTMLLRTMITASTRDRQRLVEAGEFDLYLDLDLRGVSLLDFEAVNDVAQRGYDASMPVLETWLEQDAPDF